MKELRYSDPDLLKKSLALAEDREPFLIVVSGWRVRALRTSLPLYKKYFMHSQKRDALGRVLAIPKLFAYGILSPTLWGIINSASLHGMNLHDKEEGCSLILLFSGDPGLSYSVHFTKKISG